MSRPPQALPPTRLGLARAGRSRLGSLRGGRERARLRALWPERGERAPGADGQEALLRWWVSGPHSLAEAASHSSWRVPKTFAAGTWGDSNCRRRPRARAGGSGQGRGFGERAPPLGGVWLPQWIFPGAGLGLSLSAHSLGRGLQHQPSTALGVRWGLGGPAPPRAPQDAGSHPSVERPQASSRARFGARMWASLPGAAPRGAVLRARKPGPRGKEWKGPGALTREFDSHTSEFVRKGAPFWGEEREETPGERALDCGRDGASRLPSRPATPRTSATSARTAQVAVTGTSGPGKAAGLQESLGALPLGSSWAKVAHRGLDLDPGPRPCLWDARGVTFGLGRGVLPGWTSGDSAGSTT